MHIKEERGKVIIYDIVISDELIKIRDELIREYGTITEFTKELTNPYCYSLNNKNKKEKVILIDYKFTGRYREYNDLYSPDEEIYECRFKKYEYPDIVIYINEFLDMDFKNLPKLKELIKPRKLYRLNDDNREFIQNLLPYKDYIKRIINTIKIDIVKEQYITSISDLLNVLSYVEDENLRKIYDEIKDKLEIDAKKLSYLMEANND